MDLFTFKNETALACMFWIDVLGVRVRALLDSGALISVIKKNIYGMILRKAALASMQLPLSPLQIKTYIRTAMGHTQSILGRVVLPVRLGVSADSIDSDVYLQRFSVLETLEYDVILGQDFLTTAGCTIDFSTGHVTVKAIDHTLQLFVPKMRIPDPTHHCPVVYRGPNISVPPGHMITVRCTVGKENKTGSGAGFFEPSSRHGLYSKIRPAAGPMDCPDGGEVTVIVLNVDDHQYTLYHKAILGTWIPTKFGATEPLTTPVPQDIYDRLNSLSLQEDHTYQDGVVLDILAFTNTQDDKVEEKVPAKPPPPEPPPEPPPGSSFEWTREPEKQPSFVQDDDNDPQGLDRVLNMTSEQLKQEQIKVAEAIDLSKSKLTKSQQDDLRKLLVEFYRVWAVDNLNPHRTHVMEFTINTGNATPIHARAYRVSAKENAYIAEQVRQMLKNGIIRPSTSAWSSPVVLAPKADGSLRFCIDYRRLNTLLADDRRPLPLIQDILDGLQGAEFFTSLDLASAYWSLPVKEEDKEKTAFIVKGGLYEFNCMPFGIKTAPPTFQFLMKKVLAGHPTAQPYLDDVSVVSKTWEDHLQHVRDVFQRLVDAGLTLKAKKCHFCLPEMPYLGHLAGPNGIRPNPDKVKEVQDMPTPSKKKDLRSFLGLAQYYRRFVLGFSQVASPLYELLKLHASFDWQDCHQQAFSALKESLISSPVLAYPDVNKPFTLYTDASDVGVGAVLAQEQDGVEKVVQYLSRKLDATEKKYPPTEKECLAVVWAIEKCRTYLWGSHFTVVTDCKALKWLMTTASPNGRLIRWAMRLCEYDFTVKYRKGSSNANADALSRIFSQAPLEQRYPSSGGESQDVNTIHLGDKETTADNEDFHVDETMKNQSLSRSIDPLKVVKVPEDNSGIYQTSDGTFQITAFVAEPDDQWDPCITRLATMQVTTTNDESIPEAWLEEDLENNQEAEEDQLDEYETCVHEDEILSSLKTAQAQDQELSPIIKALKGESDEQDLARVPDGYSLDGEGRLVYSRRPGGNLRLVVPKTLRKHLLHEHHTSPSAAHPGRNKTRDTVCRRYYWPGMLEDIDEWVGSCVVCTKRKASPYGRVGEQHPISTDGLFEMWGMDLLELPTSDQGNNYLLVMTEYFTRWVEAIPIKTKEAITVAGVIYRDIFCRYGAPTSILTDQGSEFANNLLTALCQSYGVKKLMTTLKKSSTNGLTERFNRTMWDMLSKKGIEEQTRWDRHIASCLYAYRSQIQESTGKSPYELLYGLPMKLPADTALRGEWQTQTRRAIANQYEELGVGDEDWNAELINQARARTRDHLQAQAQERLALKQAEQKRRWEAKARELQVLPGQKVHVRSCRGNTDALSKKIRMDWEGPYTVLKLLPRGNLLVVKEHDPSAVAEEWHISNVKPAWTSRRMRRKRIGQVTSVGESTSAAPIFCYRLEERPDVTNPYID